MKRQYEGNKRNVAMNAWFVVGTLLFLLCLAACISGSGNSSTPTPQTTPRLEETQHALDQQQYLTDYQAALQDLIAHRGLVTAKPGSAARVVAHARTVLVFREVRNSEKRTLLQSLYAQGLISVPDPVIDMTHVDVSGVDLRNMDLRGVDLRKTNLTGAQFQGTILDRANLSGATVSNEQLQEAASLQGATLPDGTTHP